MTGDRFERAREIFLAACEHAPEERDDYLAEACGSDRELRAEVDELLHFHIDESTKAEDGTPLFDSARPPEMPGSIGRYRLLQKIGEGGMGEVYEAEQDRPIRRRVALKIIKWGMDTEQVVARFESERQALALMDHSAIARVFDAGSTEQGRPFFAMEFVRGVPITEYCDRNRLGTRARLELFIQVCAGVQHAHQKGVIHRDLKPSNVLVAITDDAPVPKIIDFGIAKATSQRLTERTVFTELGQWVGTPEYMSPEQAQLTGLDIDTRTDVYSLGVLLYELLVGTQPFESDKLRSSGFDEMRRMIREQDPPRPSTRVSLLGKASTTAAANRRTDPRNLRRALQGDLDWITMKALEKDRVRRYSSSAELADDIRRHLRDEPVAAGPPSTAYRFSKFVRRHRTAVVAAGLIFIALVTGIVGTTIGLVSARRQTKAARRVADAMVAMSTDLNPAVQGGSVSSREEMLGRAVARVRSELENEPLVQARMLLTLGDAYKELGSVERARPLLEEAAEIRRRELGDDHADYAMSISFLGDLLEENGDLEGARRLHTKALAVRRVTLGESHKTVGWSLRSLGSIAHQEQKLVEADAMYRGSYDIISRAVGADSADVAITLHLQANLAWDQGHLEEARKLYGRSLEIRERTLGADHPEVGECLLDSGRLLLALGELDASRSFTGRALRIFRNVYGPDHRWAILTMGQLAVVEFAGGDNATAASLYEEILERDRTGDGSVLDELESHAEFRAMVGGLHQNQAP